MIKKSNKKPSPAQLAARAKFIKAVKSGAFRKKSKGKKKPAKKRAKVSGLTTYIAKKAIQRKLRKQTAPAQMSGLNKTQSVQTTLDKIAELKRSIETYNLALKRKNKAAVKKQMRSTLNLYKKELSANKLYLKQTLKNI